MFVRIQKLSLVTQTERRRERYVDELVTMQRGVRAINFTQEEKTHVYGYILFFN
jgi:hypothetical protein